MKFITKDELEDLTTKEINAITSEALNFRSRLSSSILEDKMKLIAIANNKTINKNKAFKVMLETSIVFDDNELMKLLISEGISFKTLKKKIDTIIKASKQHTRLPFYIINEIIGLYEIISEKYSLSNDNVNFVINKLVVIATFRQNEYQELEKSYSKKKVF